MPTADLPDHKATETIANTSFRATETIKTDIKKTTYPFVDLVRFIATMGIVFLHSEAPLGGHEYNSVMHNVNHVEYYFALKQLFKFSTICYFLIAGFLLADKITDRSPFTYYLRRLNLIARPYLIALAFFVLTLVVNEYFFSQNVFTWSFIPAAVKLSVLYTSYWYIPNYLLCLLVIVCFAKYSRSIYFGVGLLLVTLGYTYYYVYAPGHSNSHTTALFGFVFYMWLGMYIRQNGIIDKIKKISPWTIGVALMLVFMLANFESYYLFNHDHTNNNLNTLRISNQLYSLAIFAFLVRCCGSAPKFGMFNPRNETYGIYLYHSFFSFFFIPLIETGLSSYFHINLFSYNVYQIITITIANAAVIYFATTALVKLLLRFNLAYLPQHG